MRFETAERTIGRLEREKSALKEKLYEENQKLNDVKSMMDETMNGLGRF